MLCDKCKNNNATVFFRENVNGKETKYALCRECADKLEKEGKLSLNYEFPFDSFFSESDSLNNLFGSLFAPTFNVGSKKQLDKKKCSLCASTFDELISGGKVGCSKCYEIFAEELAPTIVRIHGNSKHSGRAPVKLRDKLDLKIRLQSLEKQMKEAIKSQEFERAAVIRDEIKSIKEASEGGDGR